MEKSSDGRVVLTEEEYRQLLENNERLKDAEQRANAANKAKSDFLSSMSHEIRTPMNTVLGMNELIRMTLADATLPIGEKIGRVIGYSDGIQHSGEMLLYVINDILDISKIESGKFDIRTAPYKMKKLLDDMLPMFRINAEGKSLLFESDIDEDLPGDIEGDEVRVRQIVSNIVNNAVKYTKEGTVSFSVTGRVEGDTVIYDMSVSDTGIGIKSGNLTHLFESFERVDSAETHYIEGTGLGLAIVKNLLDIMGGSIEVDSEYGRGSTFTAHIPQRILSDEKIREYIPETGPETMVHKRYYIHGKRILVVDDNITNLAVARSFLEQMRAEADTVSSGKDALHCIAEEHYDMIFLDHMMPEMSGVKVIKEIHANPDKYAANKDTPIVVMTANAVVGAREQYMNEYGFDGFIAKPFRFAELEILMSTFIEGDENVEEEAISPTGMERGDVNRPADRMDSPDGELGKDLPVGPPSGYAGGPPTGMGGPPPGAKGAVYDIDVETGIETCGDKKTYEIVAETYLESSDEYKENLASYHAAEDWENYRITVHALKSSSLTIGAINFSDFSKSVEHAARELIDGKDLMKNLGYLRGSFRPYAAAYAAVCESLRGVMSGESAE